MKPSDIMKILGWTIRAIVLATLTTQFAVRSDAGLFKVDYAVDQNDSEGVELTDWDTIATWTFDDFADGIATWNLTDFGSGSDSDVTLTIIDNEPLSADMGFGSIGMIGNNPVPQNIDVNYDSINVPAVVKDDYLYRNPDTAGSELLFRFANLDPGTYNVTVFEGRTTDASQFGRLWIGDINGSNEPTEQNTGDFSGTDVEGAVVPEGNPKTITFDIADGEYLWYAHMEDNSGGISGMIIRPLPAANTGLFKIDYAVDQNDVEGVELTDWDTIPTWTFEDFVDGDATWSLTDFAGGNDSDVTLTIIDNEPLSADMGFGTIGMIGNNPVPQNMDVIYDSISVPAVVKDDYLYRNPDTGGSELLFRFANLDPGMYNVTVFEGRTTDAAQFGRLWIGDMNGSNEPAEQNTGDFSGTDSDGVATPEGNPKTLALDIADGEFLWYAHMEDNSGGISGMIIRSISAVLDSDNDGMPDLWETQFGLDPNDPSDANEDCNGNGVINLDEFEANLDPCDTTPPAVISTEGSRSVNTMLLTFSEQLNPTEANDPSNYSISPNLAVTVATYSELSGAVTLTTAAQTPDTIYTITLKGLKDISQNVVSEGANAIVEPFAFTKTGVLKFSYWGDVTGGAPITGATVVNLTDDPRSFAPPDMVLTVHSFDSRDAFPDDSHNNYGATIEGLITPTESGDYHFFLRSNGASELFVSIDENPLNQVFQAEEMACCKPFQEPADLAFQTTLDPVPLIAGKSYYIRAIYKEGVAEDYCQVAWRKTTDTTPARDLLPIPSEFLSSLEDLVVPAPVNGGTPNADGTLVATEGGLSRVAWNGSGVNLAFYPEKFRGKHRLEQITLEPRTDDQGRFVSYFETPNSGDINVAPEGDFFDNYAVILYGFIHPSETGSYRFALAADDAAELHLSTDENPTNSVRIASEPQWNPVRSFGSTDRRPNGENLSAGVELEAGQKYYVEAIMKEGGGGDNLAVAWKGPGDG
ncbi:MAG TPA: hypothetical protein EYG38_05365, partial [Verrucomicrobia bacterium]|nr:hypothetical protein [Verrucomicrobiota bacterium]